jgi:hypothetical protein
MSQRKKIIIEQKKETELEPDTPEYRIAVIQLHRLEQIALERLFTKEEATIYDTLCRNLKLAKGDPTTIRGEYTKLDANALDVNDLMELASGGKFLEESTQEKVQKKDNDSKKSKSRTKKKRSG